LGAISNVLLVEALVGCRTAFSQWHEVAHHASNNCLVCVEPALVTLLTKAPNPCAKIDVPEFLQKSNRKGTAIQMHVFFFLRMFLVLNLSFLSNGTAFFLDHDARDI
jgi:hypothetical protein